MGVFRDFGRVTDALYRNGYAVCNIVLYSTGKCREFIIDIIHLNRECVTDASMTWNHFTFRTTGPFAGESTGHQWIVFARGR